MAKKGTYNGPFFKNFGLRLHGTPIRFGLLLGQQVEDSLGDVVFAAPTPPQPCEDGEASAPQALPRDVSMLLKSSRAGVAFAHWALEHAEAVRKLLPAGLEPLGCFLVTSEASAKDLAALLVPVLGRLANPLVLSIDPTSRKLTFWQFSGGAKPALRPAQMKADSYKDHLLLWTATPVDVIVPQSRPATSEGQEDTNITDALSADVERGLGETLRRCPVAVADGAGVLQVVDLASEALLSSAATKGEHELNVAFLRSGSTLVQAPNPDARPLLRQRCLVVSTAVMLRRNVELRHAVEMLRKELVASAVERLRLGLKRHEESGEGRQVHLPWRALCRPKELELPLWCGLYCLPDEALGPAQERLGQLLGLPEGAFDEAPDHLDEQGRLSQDHVGTYGPQPREEEEDKEEEKAPAATRASAAVPGLQGSSPAPLAACAAAVVLTTGVCIALLLR